MNKHLKQLAIASSILMMTSCNVIPPEAYYARGNPDSLLEQTSEVINFDLGDYNGVDDIMNWVNNERPSRAEAKCVEGSYECITAINALRKAGVPSVFIASSDNVVSLVYDSVMAKDCENRYIENGVNPYNLNHASFGCSTASNMVQMVSDKRQFTNPALLALPGAGRIDRVMEGYKKPYNVKAPTINSDFETNFELQLQSR